MPRVITDKQKIDNILNRAVAEVLPTKEGLGELLLSGKRIRLYLGIDPTNPEIHLGNAIALHKLRQFQELGHDVIFLVGSFTALVGDPSDKESQRPLLTEEEVKNNMKKYKKLASKILDFSKARLLYNGEWLSKLPLQRFFEIASHLTVQQLIERDLYKKRLKAKKPLGVNEFLYPLLQGYDSVVMDVDLEIGGTDQTFNMLVGRQLQKIYNTREKYVMTLPLIAGTDGRKMSKSYGNFISLTDNPDDMYGKVMSLKDDLIIRYFECCSNIEMEKVDQMQKELENTQVNPIDLKKGLAREIVTMYHSKEAANKAEKKFERVVQAKEVPEEIPTIRIQTKAEIKMVDLLIESEMVDSKSNAKRLIQQGGVEVNQKKVTNPNKIIRIRDGDIVRVGKRKFAKIIT